jgi:hypothetical protein
MVISVRSVGQHKSARPIQSSQNVHDSGMRNRDHIPCLQWDIVPHVPRFNQLVQVDGDNVSTWSRRLSGLIGWLR